MAVGDKLVTLDGLKAVYQDLNGNTNDLKSAINGTTGNVFGKWQSGYYRTEETGDAVSLISDSTMVTTRIPVNQGDHVVINATGGSGYSRLYVLLDSNGASMGRSDPNLSGITELYIPAGVSEIAVNNRLTMQPTGYYAYTGYTLSEMRDMMVFDYPHVVPGNFSGQNLWSESSTTSVARTSIFENFGDCIIRSTINGIKLSVYGASEQGSSSLIAQANNVLIISGKYNYGRIRIQSDGANITNFTNYCEKLIVIEPIGGMAYRLSNAEKNIELADNLLDVSGTLTATKTYSVVLPKFVSKNIMCEVEAKYTGDVSNDYLYPLIYMQSGYGSYTSSMKIGGKDEFIRNTIRFYPLLIDNALTLNLEVYVPSGMTLTIKRLRVYFGNTITRTETPLRIAAHSGFRNAPQFSKLAGKLIAQLGATHCVQLPKRTSDGVWVCYHDDTFYESTTFLRNADGTAISDSQYNGLAFSQIPSSYLYGLDWGVSINAAFAGTKPQTIPDFFAACAKSGVHPMLSFHPASQSTATNFAEIRALAEKYGVLRYLGIKIPAVSNAVADLETAFGVFGYDIESYTANVVANGNVASVISAFDALDIDKSKVECVIEQFAGSSTLTSETISAVISSGYRAGVAEASHTRASGTTGSDLNYVDYDYYTSLGVTSFTSRSFASYGLNW